MVNTPRAKQENQRRSAIVTALIVTSTLECAKSRTNQSRQHRRYRGFYRRLWQREAI
jgi:hypothetical protein